MPFRDPLSLVQLRAIQARHPREEDVLTLLWEVKRLRSLVLRFNQLAPDLKRPKSVLSACFDLLVAELPYEPCVLEQKAWIQELLPCPAKPRKTAPTRPSD